MLNELCCTCTLHRWKGLALRFPSVYGAKFSDENFLGKSQIIGNIQYTVNCGELRQSIPQSITRDHHGGPDFWLSTARFGALGDVCKKSRAAARRETFATDKTRVATERPARVAFAVAGSWCWVVRGLRTGGSDEEPPRRWTGRTQPCGGAAMRRDAWRLSTSHGAPRRSAARSAERAVAAACIAATAGKRGRVGSGEDSATCHRTRNSTGEGPSSAERLPPPEAQRRAVCANGS